MISRDLFYFWRLILTAYNGDKLNYIGSTYILTKSSWFYVVVCFYFLFCDIIIVMFDWILSLFYHHTKKLIIIKSYTNNNNMENAHIIAGFPLVKIARLRIWLVDDVISITRYQCKSQLNNMIFLSVSHFFVLCYHQDSWGNYWNKIFEHSPAFEKMMS